METEEPQEGQAGRLEVAIPRLHFLWCSRNRSAVYHGIRENHFGGPFWTSELTLPVVCPTKKVFIFCSLAWLWRLFTKLRSGIGFESSGRGFFYLLRQSCHYAVLQSYGKAQSVLKFPNLNLTFIGYRTRRQSIFQQPPLFSKGTQNLWLFPAIAFAIGVIFIFLYIPGIQNAINSTPAPVEYFFFPFCLWSVDSFYG